MMAIDYRLLGMRIFERSRKGAFKKEVGLGIRLYRPGKPAKYSVRVFQKSQISRSRK